MTNIERFQMTERDLFDPRVRRRTPYPFLSKLGGWIAVLAILAGIAIATYYYWQRQLSIIAPSATAPPSLTPRTPAAAGESTVRHPIPQAGPQSGYTEPLPALEQSDEALQNHAVAIFGSKAFQELFYPGKLSDALSSRSTTFRERSSRRGCFRASRRPGRFSPPLRTAVRSSPPRTTNVMRPTLRWPRPLIRRSW